MLKTRDEILKFVIDNNTNKLKRNLVRNKILEKNIDILESIYKITNFLDIFDDVSINERIFYIQNNITHVLLCPYCNIRKIKFNKCSYILNKYCSNINCYYIYGSQSTMQWHKSLTKEDRQRINKIISIKNSGSFEEKYGKERADELKKKQCVRNKNRIQSESEKIKRVQTRKQNNKVWHTEKTKQLIKESNIKVMTSPEFKAKRHEIYKNSYKKISEKLKNKIKNGEFTPCITNSWTHWESYLIINSKKIKYRSDWEACFHLLNQHLEYETVRIPYCFNNECHTYIVDFCDVNNKILYEIKPSTQIDTEKNISKFKYCNDWCISNDFIFEIITEEYFINKYDLININEQPQLNKFKNMVYKWAQK